MARYIYTHMRPVLIWVLMLMLILAGAGVTLPHGMVKVGMDTDSGDNVSRRTAYYQRRTLIFTSVLI